MAPDDLAGLAADAIAAARRAGALDVEVALGVARVRSVDLEAGQVARIEDITDEELHLRVRTPQGVGHASGPFDGLADVAAHACATARPVGDGFAFVADGGGRTGRPARLRALDRLAADAAVLLEIASVDGAELAAGSVTMGVGHELVATSGGFLGEVHSSWHAASAHVVAPADVAGTGSADRYDPARPIDAATVADEARRKAVAARDPGRAGRLRPLVVFASEAFEELLGAVLVPALRGERVARRESPLADRVGTTVAAPSLVVDEAAPAPGLPHPEPWDDEGAPVRARAYLRDGVLHGYATSRLEAHRHGLAPEGPGVRGSGVYGMPRNLIVRSEPCAGEELLARAAGGVRVESVLGAHTADATNGTWSVEAAVAHGIGPGGSLGGPINGVVVSGTLDDLLMGAIASGLDARWSPGTPAWHVPSILVEGCAVQVRRG